VALNSIDIAKSYLFYSSSEDVAWLYPILNSLVLKYNWWQQPAKFNLEFPRAEVQLMAATQLVMILHWRPKAGKKIVLNANEKYT
jgi:hypothetical protein